MELTNAKRCVKCASAGNGDSKCHPEFIIILPRDVTLPEACTTVERKLIPRFTSSVRMAEYLLYYKLLKACVLFPFWWAEKCCKCMHCGEPYGTKGCLPIGEVIKCAGDETIEVKHNY